MSRTYIASFESKTMGPVDIYRGHDDETIEQIENHSSDPGIVLTLGRKDSAKRFAKGNFLNWEQKGGGRFVYTGWNQRNFAALFWIGGEPFPENHFPDSFIQPPYTAAWRTEYLTPDGRTYGGQGIGKRIALAGFADVMALTKNGGPILSINGTNTQLPPLEDAGVWIDTGIGNTRGRDLYHHLGFVDVGVYEPPYQEGATDLDLEPRVGMVASPAKLKLFNAAASVLLRYAS